MPDENATQQTAQPENAESGTAEAVIPESATGNPVEGEPQIPEEPGTEPDADPKQEPEQSQAVKELIAQRKKRQFAEQEAAYWRGKAESKDTIMEQSAPPTGEPKIEQYENYEDYQIAIIEYKVDQKLENKTKAVHDAEILNAYNNRLKKKPELAEKIANAQLPQNAIESLVKNEAIKVIQSSEYGPEIAAIIAEDTALAIELSQMTKSQAGRMIGKLEARFETPNKQPEQKKQVTQAPAPITPTSGKAAGVKSIESMSVAEHIAYHNDLDRKKGYLKY